MSDIDRCAESLGFLASWWCTLLGCKGGRVVVGLTEELRYPLNRLALSGESIESAEKESELCVTERG